jgi:uncharacterized protein YecE (DUF72 family)
VNGIFVGTAGWSIPRDVADRFAADGSGLERYASHFRVVEINSSFHRPHRSATWQRWHDSVPDDFRFSVKVPKEITHVHKLVACSDALGRFIEQVQILGEKLAVLLIQLPPKLEFDADVASSFLDTLRTQSAAHLALEPRNESWFTLEADAFLRDQRVARVAADPAIRAEAAVPGGSDHLSYWRLHGSPAIYRSSYEDRIDQIATALRADAATGRPVWCIFDNTASSAGGRDASNLLRRLDC